MQGLILTLSKGPRDDNVRSYTVAITVGIGATRIINFKAEFRGLARSVSFFNRDGVNNATVILNNDRINTFTVASNGTFTLNDQWCEQIEIIAGAAGLVNTFSEIVPESDLGLG